MHRSTSPVFVFDSLESRRLFSGTQVVGYLPEYEYAATINKIDFSAITQLNYFAAIPDAATGKLPTTNTPTCNLAHLNHAMQLAHAAGVKVNIVVGGAGMDGAFPTIAASASLRTAFANSVKSFCTAHHLDGVDLDWEPLNPTQAQITNYGKLIDALRTGTTGLELSAAVNPEKLPIAGKTTSAYVLNPTAIADLDSIGVMAYDLDFAFHSPFPRSTKDLKAWGSYVSAHGVSKTKLVFGLPFYGRAGTSWSNSVAEGYGAIIDRYIVQTGTSPSPAADNLDVRFGSSVFNNQPVTWYFNGPTTISNKTQYALNNGFGGVMIWELGLDHFAANGSYDQYSLLPVVKQVVSGFVAEHSQLAASVISPFSTSAISFDDLTNVVG